MSSPPGLLQVYLLTLIFSSMGYLSVVFVLLLIKLFSATVAEAMACICLVAHSLSSSLLHFDPDFFWCTWVSSWVSPEQMYLADCDISRAVM